MTFFLFGDPTWDSGITLDLEGVYLDSILDVKPPPFLSSADRIQTDVRGRGSDRDSRNREKRYDGDGDGDGDGGGGEDGG